MNSLEKLFASGGQVKIMRLFIFNPNTSFDAAEVARRTKVRPVSVRKVLSGLEKARLIKSKSVSRTTAVRGKKKSKKVRGWFLNEAFPYLMPLKNLLMPTDSLTYKGIEKKLRPSGRIKLILISGVFMHDPEARVDILVVGDALKTKSLTSAMGDLEAQLGAELAYTALDTEDFLYRQAINDRLIRDIFDYPHQIILDKLRLSDVG